MNTVAVRVLGWLRPDPSKYNTVALKEIMLISARTNFKVHLKYKNDNDTKQEQKFI